MKILAMPPVKHQYLEVPSCAAEGANALHSAANLGAYHGYIYSRPVLSCCCKRLQTFAAAEISVLCVNTLMMSGQHSSGMRRPLSCRIECQRFPISARLHMHVLMLSCSDCMPVQIVPALSGQLCLYPTTLCSHSCSAAAQEACLKIPRSSLPEQQGMQLMPQMSSVCATTA